MATDTVLIPTTYASATGTATPVPLVPSATAIPSATSTPDIRLEVRCLEIAPEPPAEARPEGRVVLSSLDYTGDEYVLLDLATAREIALPRQRAGNDLQSLHVSPTRRLLAYRDVGETETARVLTVVTADGQVQQTLPWQDSWRHIAGWLDDQRLLISRERGEKEYDSLVVLNPFTGEQHELPPDYPDLYYGGAGPAYGPGWGWFDASRTVYDPRLSRVIYPGMRNDGSETLFLRDLKTDREIAAIAGTVSYGVTPRWAPDGQRFVISGPARLLSSPPRFSSSYERQELFSVSRDGAVRQLTRLTDAYPLVAFGPYSWSPDGRYIAFMLIAGPRAYPDLYPTTQPANLSRLAVLDTVTLQVTDYCVPGYFTYSPLWSPDGRQVVIEDFYHSTLPRKGKVYLVDFAQGFAVQIAENLSPYGWMRPNP